MTTEETGVLETLLARYAVAHVLDGIADLVSDRAEQIRIDSKDTRVALKWDQAAVEIGRLASRIEI